MISRTRLYHAAWATAAAFWTAGLCVALSGNPAAAAGSLGQQSDTFKYDPEAAGKQQVIDQEMASMDACVRRNVGALIQSGVRSRSQLKRQLIFCANILQGSKGIPVDRTKAHQV
jgi:hypothetical protein